MIVVCAPVVSQLRLAKQPEELRCRCAFCSGYLSQPAFKTRTSHTSNNELAAAQEQQRAQALFGTVAYSQAQSLTLEATHQTVAPAAGNDSEMSVKQVRGVQSE